MAKGPFTVYLIAVFLQYCFFKKRVKKDQMRHKTKLCTIYMFIYVYIVCVRIHEVNPYSEAAFPAAVQNLLYGHQTSVTASQKTGSPRRCTSSESGGDV